MRDAQAENLARQFHEAYERLAPEFGYKTREASAVPWKDVPSDNRSLMLAVADEILTKSKPSRWKWLESTAQLQRTHYGLDYAKLKGEALADYFMVHYTALTCELVEFMDEVNWKPWMKDRRGDVPDRDAAVGELIDAAHFLANLACALGVTDAEWEEKYQAKQERNRRRQESGSYTKDTYKCPDCRRELDRPGAISRRPGAEREYFCFACMFILDITHRCDHCGLIEPKLTDVDGVNHCDNCGHAILV